MTKYARSKSNSGAGYTIAFDVPAFSQDTTWYLKPDNHWDLRKVGSDPIKKEGVDGLEAFDSEDDQMHWEKRLQEVKKNAGEYKSSIPFFFDQLKKFVGLKENGGKLSWMNKFANGGQANKMMQQIISIVKKAAQEIQKGQPGEGVQALAQIMQDQQGAQLIQQLSQQNPQIGEIAQAAMEMVQSAEKGSKLENKFAKGGCACKKHKKLMKIGGKLTEVTVDCEDRIIVPVAKKGCKVRKGESGLAFNPSGLTETYRTGAQGTGTSGQTHYYLADDGKWRMQTWNDAVGTKGQDGYKAAGWGDAQEVTMTDPTQLSALNKFFLGENTASVGNNPEYKSINTNAFNVGYNPLTGKYDSIDNSRAGQGTAWSAQRSNTGNYGFTITRDTNVDGGSDNNNNIVSATLDGSKAHAERMARRQLRQDKRDAKAYVRQYGDAYVNEAGNTGKKAARADLGLGTSARKLMKGEGSGLLGERGVSAQAGINLATSWNAANKKAISTPGSTTVTSVPSSTTSQSTTQQLSTPFKTNLGSGALQFKNGGWLEKYACGNKIVKDSNPAETLNKRSDTLDGGQLQEIEVIGSKPYTDPRRTAYQINPDGSINAREVTKDGWSYRYSEPNVPFPSYYEDDNKWYSGHHATFWPNYNRYDPVMGTSEEEYLQELRNEYKDVYDETKKKAENYNQALEAYNKLPWYIKLYRNIKGTNLPKHDFNKD